MQKTRLFLSLVLMAGPVAMGSVACGGDDSAASSSGSPPDGSTTNDSGSPNDAGEDGAAVLKANAPAVNVYLGQLATLDGSSSTGPVGLTYAWTVASAPAGSAVATSTLTHATSAKPSFVPDRVGAYVLSLTIAAGSAKASANVTVTAADPPVFYFSTENDPADAGYTATLNVVGAGAGAGNAVGCFSSKAGSYDTMARRAATAGTDWWEAPAGEPSRVVFGFEEQSDAGPSTVLFATTSTGTCATPPRKLDSYPGVGGAGAVQRPSFSPSGDRIAYIIGGDGVRVVTVGFDGSARRVLAPYEAFPDGGPNPEAGVPLPAQSPIVWVNETTIAWLQVLDNTTWQIVSASDTANSPPTLLMSCAGHLPDQFDILSNGEIVVSRWSGGETGGTDLVVYPITAPTKACGTARNLTKLVSTSGGSYARDFALSPDKTRIAYKSYSDVTGNQELAVVAVDGLTPPAVVTTRVGANRGPRWVGGGAFLAWSVSAGELDAGSGNGNAIAVALADGGSAVRAVASASAKGQLEAVGNGEFSCSFGPAVGSSMSLFGVAGLFALRLVRRRRR